MMRGAGGRDGVRFVGCTNIRSGTRLACQQSQAEPYRITPNALYAHVKLKSKLATLSLNASIQVKRIR
jgi:hypothetical protein